MTSGTKLRVWHGAVLSEWIDYNGHMNEGFYGLVFAMASDEYLLRLGFDEDYRSSAKGAFYTAETHTVFIDELTAGESLAVDTTVVGGDPKRVHLFHELRSLDRRNANRRVCDAVAATQESMMLHVDTVIGRVAPMRDDLHKVLRSDVHAHAGILPPDATSRSIRPVPA